MVAVNDDKGVVYVPTEMLMLMVKHLITVAHVQGETESNANRHEHTLNWFRDLNELGVNPYSIVYKR